MQIRCASQSRQSGIAAVEFALVLLLLVLMLVVPLYLGRVMWHYAAIQKAAQNGARLLAAAPLVIMKDPNKAAYMTQLTRDIVWAHLEDLNPGQFPPTVDIQCNGISCNGFSSPTTVRVVVQAYMQDIFFPQSELMAITITGEATFAYLGK